MILNKRGRRAHQAQKTSEQKNWLLWSLIQIHGPTKQIDAEPTTNQTDKNENGLVCHKGMVRMLRVAPKWWVYSKISTRAKKKKCRDTPFALKYTHRNVCIICS